MGNLQNDISEKKNSDNTQLRYVKVDRNFRDLDKVEEIYTNSFPSSETPFSVSRGLEMAEKMPITIIAVYDGDVLVGFYVVKEQGQYRYLNYLAVDQTIRGKGYGGRILQKLLDDSKDTIFFASIEKPIPGRDDYDTRLRRQQFYEKNGMTTVYNQRITNGNEFITVTNKTGDAFQKCYEAEMKELEMLLKQNRT